MRVGISLMVGVWLSTLGCAAGGGMSRDAGGGPRDARVTRDAGEALDASELEDAGATVDASTAADDAALDAAALDAAAPDAGIDAAAADGGALAFVAPTIDGVVSDAEWAGAARAENTIATIWAGNELLVLRAGIAGGSLYLAVEGAIETSGAAQNAIVIFIDRDMDAADGVADLSSLIDTTGALDNALTGTWIQPAGFRADAAWGTRDLSRVATGSDDRMGFRDLTRGSPADLYWVLPTLAPSACSASACEARIPLSELGGVAPRRVGLFARIVNADGEMSPNQTLPMDDPSMPRIVSRVLEVAE